MIVISEESRVGSPYIEWVGQGYTGADGLIIRPAEYNWHLIFTRYEGILRILVVGALEEARPLNYVAGAESLWIRFKVGTYMPCLPAPATLNREINLPQGSANTFWLKDKVWEVPSFENADTFVEHLARAGVVIYEPLIEAALRDELEDASERTIRYRFHHCTGLRQNYIRQIKRAQQAVELLQHGNSILKTAHELGYADQPHLTRSLKRLLGHTPRELLTSAK
ncbi:MAG: helix-turn-helix domain-containing protein [Anaerolineae bacterium]|nr:helix-turn-helix domain-containing protein [Anaerolineae bacterium]